MVHASYRCPSSPFACEVIGPSDVVGMVADIVPSSNKPPCWITSSWLSWLALSLLLFLTFHSQKMPRAKHSNLNFRSGLPWLLLGCFLAGSGGLWSAALSCFFGVWSSGCQAGCKLSGHFTPVVTFSSITVDHSPRKEPDVTRCNMV
jgi:hypothetical protein